MFLFHQRKCVPWLPWMNGSQLLILLVDGRKEHLLCIESKINKAHSERGTGTHERDGLGPSRWHELR